MALKHQLALLTLIVAVSIIVPKMCAAVDEARLKAAHRQRRIILL